MNTSRKRHSAASTLRDGAAEQHRGSVRLLAAPGAATEKRPMRGNRMTAEARVEFKAASAGSGGSGGGAKRPTLSIEAYNGGLITPWYPYWPTPCVIDLSQLQAAEPIAILLDHYPDQIVGQSSAVQIGADSLHVDGVVTGDIENPDDPAHKVVLHAGNGFVWKASIGLDGKYEFVSRDQVVTVNGNQFAGPCYVVRGAVMDEVSLLSIAADASSSTKVAASAARTGDGEMDFHEWLRLQGFDPATLNEKQREAMLKAFKRETGSTGTGPAEPSPAASGATGGNNGGGNGGGGANGTLTAAGGSRGPEANGDDPFAHIEGRVQHRARLTARAVQFADQHEDLAADVRRLLGSAIADQMSMETFELRLMRLRGERPLPANQPRGTGIEGGPVEQRVLEAGLCMAGGLPQIEQHYEPRVCEAAQRRWRHGLGLGEFLLTAARQNGFDGLSHRNVGPLLRAAFPVEGRLQAEGPSTFDISGTLSNVANKFIVNFFMAVDSVWRMICAIRPVNDFKQISSYSLNGDFTYQKLPPGGEIEHGTIGETKYTNQADTYARMFQIDRRDIINDDLGAFMQITKRLGRGGALALNDIIWPLFMNNGAFFTAGRGNFASGAGTALGIDSLAQAEQMFNDQTDPDGKPMALIPRVLLVPTALKRLAMQIMNSTEIRRTPDSTAGGEAAVKYGTNNTFNGDFSTGATPYLGNAAITGNSTKKWYLLADPNDVATIEVCFLNGVERPTVESAQADFDSLGVKMRGYFDFGVALQEYRAAVAMKGEA
jgi:hypothetical protein